MSYTSRLQQLLAAAKRAHGLLHAERDSLVESHTPMSLQPKPENVPEPEVRAQIRRMDRALAQLRKAIGHYEMPPAVITCKRCRTTDGRHYCNCPQATPENRITGPAE